MDRPEWIDAALARGRSAVSRLGGVTERVRERPAVAIAAAALALLVIVWIIWAIHVGSTNGGDAAVGVLITWPLLFLIAASLALLGVGVSRLARRLQPSNGTPSEEAPKTEASEEETETAASEEETEAAEDDEGKESEKDG